MFTIIQENNETRVKNKILGYEITIPEDRFVPRSGLEVCAQLTESSLQNKRVLDIGTGDGALLAIHSATLGAAHIDAIEPDVISIEIARTNVTKNYLSNKISLTNKSFEDFISTVTEGYDVVLANLPQMPVPNDYSLHDDGGVDGKRIILDVIQNLSVLLRKDGIVIMNLFDFLGIETSFNFQDSLSKICRELGYEIKILGKVKKYVRPEGRTAEMMEYILSVYSSYELQKDEKGSFITMDIIQIKKIRS